MIGIEFLRELQRLVPDLLRRLDLLERCIAQADPAMLSLLSEGPIDSAAEQRCAGCGRARVPHDRSTWCQYSGHPYCRLCSDRIEAVQQPRAEALEVAHQIAICLVPELLRRVEVLEARHPLRERNAARQADGQRLREAIACILESDPTATATRVLGTLEAAEPGSKLPSARTVRWHLQALRQR